MEFYQPIWFLSLIPLGVLWFTWKMPGRLLATLRAVIFALLVLALAQPVIHLPNRSGTIVVIADRSASMPANNDDSLKELIQLVQTGMRKSNSIAVITFGEQAIIDHPPEAGRFINFSSDAGRHQSNLEGAMEKALNILPEEIPSRILIISDGKYTGKNPSDIVPRFVGRGISVDYRFLQRSSVQDTAVSDIQSPEAVEPNQAFMVHGWIHSPVTQDISYQLKRGNLTLSSGMKSVPAGLSRIIFRDLLAQPGSYSYTLSVDGQKGDPVPENNTARFFVNVRGPRPLLCVTARTDSGFARALEASGLNVECLKPNECSWRVEDLAKYSGVIIENVSASSIDRAGMENISAWVKEIGGGFMMTGGKSSYGIGGYYLSPVEKIMPVSMEMRKEQRKTSLAMVVALDRSGSMTMSVGGGKTKMDLANLGTVQVLDMLFPEDEFGVVAVDSSAHVIANLDTVEKNLALRGKILQIDSMGGGIFIYEALSSACRMLAGSSANSKHITLFADASDSEEPGAYRELLEKARLANITVSVVGLGTDKDCDAELLIEIARLGGGISLFTADPVEIPRLFVQDTLTVARSTFIEELTKIRLTTGLNSLTGMNFGQPPEANGYNLCYLKSGASVAALTEDENQTPFVSWWHCGSGRALCYTGEADGSYTGPFGRWNQAGSFFASLARWTAGETEGRSGDFMVTQEIRDGIYDLKIHLDPEREKEPFLGEPKANILRGEPGKGPRAEEHAFKRDGPDMFSLQVPVGGNETLLSALQVSEQRNMVLSPVCLAYSPEYIPDQQRKGKGTLQLLSKSTGGEERINLPEMWNALPRKPRSLQLTPILLLLSLLTFLIEIFQRRTGLLSFLNLGRIYSRVTASVNPPAGEKKEPSQPVIKKEIPRTEAKPEVVPSKEASGEKSTISAMRELRKKMRKP